LVGESVFRFTLIFEGPSRPDSITARPAGTLADEDGGVDFVEVDAEAGDLPTALSDAISAAEAQSGRRVRRVEPDDMVTATEIAERLGRSRESIRLLASGARGPGGFPAPISHARTRQRLWRWSDVAAWANLVGDDERQRARYLAVVNAALDLRSLASAADRFVHALVTDAIGAVRATASAGTGSKIREPVPPDLLDALTRARAVVPPETSPDATRSPSPTETDADSRAATSGNRPPTARCVMPTVPDSSDPETAEDH
jgi:hypothetical protein